MFPVFLRTTGIPAVGTIISTTGDALKVSAKRPELGTSTASAVKLASGSGHLECKSLTTTCT
jgi:hypothetical protein